MEEPVLRPPGDAARQLIDHEVFHARAALAERADALAGGYIGQRISPGARRQARFVRGVITHDPAPFAERRHAQRVDELRFAIPGGIVKPVRTTRGSSRSTSSKA